MSINVNFDFDFDFDFDNKRFIGKYMTAACFYLFIGSAEKKD